MQMGLSAAWGGVVGNRRWPDRDGGADPATLPFAEAVSIAPCVRAEPCCSSELTQAGPRLFLLRVAAGHTSYSRLAALSQLDAEATGWKKRYLGRCPGMSRIITRDRLRISVLWQKPQQLDR